MKEKVLITGGSGLIGGKLTRLLQSEGYEVSHLSRSVNSKYGVKTHVWDLKKMTIDKDALDDVNFIVHLAGIGITEKPWTNKFRLEIVRSRIDGITLLKNLIEEKNIKLKAFVSASGVNYYGSKTIINNVTEDFAPAEDFLAKTCVYWENYADKLADLTRVVKLRTGIVLDSNSGAYPKLSESFKYRMGAVLGSGKQYMPWIHIDDVCRMYLYALKNSEIKGSYNAVAPECPTNNDFSISLAKSLNKKMWLPSVPSTLLKIIFGDMADLFLYGNEVKADKIIESGFQFKYPKLKPCFEDLKS